MDYTTLQVDPKLTAVKLTKAVTTIPITKPDPQMWVMIHPEWELGPLPAVTLDQRTYILSPEIAQSVLRDSDWKLIRLYPTITLLGDVSLWPVPLDGSNSWSDSMIAAASRARKGLIRVQSNQRARQYEVRVPLGEVVEPVWPNLTFDEILDIGLRDWIIDSDGHPVVRRLLGQL